MAVAAAILALTGLVAAVATGHRAGDAVAKAKGEAHKRAATKAPVSGAPKPRPQKARAPKSTAPKQAGGGRRTGGPRGRKLGTAPNPSGGSSKTLSSKDGKKGGSKTLSSKGVKKGGGSNGGGSKGGGSKGGGSKGGGSKGGGSSGGGNGGKKPRTFKEASVDAAPNAPASPPAAVRSNTPSPPSTTPAPVRQRSAPRTSRRGAAARPRGGSRSIRRRPTSAPPDGVGSPFRTAARSAGSQRDRGDRTARKSGGPRAPEDGPSVARTVRDIVEVVPDAVKVALAGLLALSAVLGAGYLLAATRASRLARQRGELLQDVGLLQTALLPPVPASVGAMRTSVAYRPSDGPGAGGDFYDALSLPGGRAAFILGDVSGHGRQALARTAFIRYTLRAYVEAGLEPWLALQLAAPVIGEHLGGDFATVALAVHNPQSASLIYACAGHPAPIVVGPTRHEPVLAASSPPIGLGMRTGLRQTTVPLPPGSLVCLYTDGLTEARTDDGILGRPRLADLVEELGRDATAPAVLERVVAEARLVTDDMATVILSPNAGVTAGGFREERLELDLDELGDGLGERFLEACAVERTQLESALAEARAWAGAHGAAVISVRFGVRGRLVEVLPRNVESLEAASRRRALA